VGCERDGKRDSHRYWFSGSQQKEFGTEKHTGELGHRARSGDDLIWGENGGEAEDRFELLLSGISFK